MAKKKNNKNNPYNSPQKAGLKNTLSKFNWSLAGLFLLIFILVFAVYHIGIHFSFYPTLPIYFALTLILGLAYAFYNRGIIGRIPSTDELNQSWSGEQKSSFISDAKKRKKKSRILLIFFASFVITFLIDAILAMLDNIGINFM